MITSIFSVFDSKTAAYMTPFFMLTKPAAMRAISDTVNDETHQFNRHAEDYSLFYLGTLNDENCGFDLLDSPLHLCGLHELKSLETS